jgi:hypothetical protein
MIPQPYAYLSAARNRSIRAVFLKTSISALMEVTEDLEKWDIKDSARGFSASQVISKESVMDEALDAEANMEPPTAATVSTTDKTGEPGPPPNGGFAAWLQVAGSFFLFFNGWVSIKSIPNDVVG